MPRAPDPGRRPRALPRPGSTATRAGSLIELVRMSGPMHGAIGPVALIVFVLIGSASCDSSTRTEGPTSPAQSERASTSVEAESLEGVWSTGPVPIEDIRAAMLAAGTLWCSGRYPDTSLAVSSPICTARSAWRPGFPTSLENFSSPGFPPARSSLSPVPAASRARSSPGQCSRPQVTRSVQPSEAPCTRSVEDREKTDHRLDRRRVNVIVPRREQQPWRHAGTGRSRAPSYAGSDGQREYVPDPGCNADERAGSLRSKPSIPRLLPPCAPRRPPGLHPSHAEVPRSDRACVPAQPRPHRTPRG